MRFGSLGSVTGIVFLHRFLTTSGVFEIAVTLAALGSSSVSVAPVVHVYGFLVHGFVTTVVGLSITEYLRGELVLTLSESVHFGRSNVNGMFGTSLRGPIGIRAELVFRCISVEILVLSSSK